MKSLKEISIGFLSAIASSVIILGAILVAMTEGQVMVVPTAQATVTEPVFIDTTAPGEPTLTRPPVQPTLRPVIVTPTPVSHCPAPAGWVSYTFQAGDKVSILAAARGVSVDVVVKGNCLSGPDAVLDGSTLMLPPLPTATLTATIIPSNTISPTIQVTLTLVPSPTRCIPVRPGGWVAYIVQPGDTLYRLSQAVNIDELVLMRINCIVDPNALRAGQTLYLPINPQPSAVPTDTPRPTVFIPTRTFTPRPTFTRTLTQVPPSITPTPTLQPPTITITSTPIVIPPTHTVTVTPVPTLTVAPPTSTPVPTATNTTAPTAGAIQIHTGTYPPEEAS